MEFAYVVRVWDNRWTCNIIFLHGISLIHQSLETYYELLHGYNTMSKIISWNCECMRKV